MSKPSEMARQHVVQPSECLNSIGARYGFSPQTLWEHGDNADLRERRKDPNVLLAGDVVAIPDLTLRHHAADTGKRHRYRRKAVPVRVSMKLVNGEEPRAGVPYRLEVDGKLLQGKSDDDGTVEFWIQPGTETATLRISAEETYDLHAGRLDPATEESGVRHRLVNLGYLDADADDDELDVAIIAFKRDHCGLEITPEELLEYEDDEYQKAVLMDDATREKLVSLHGS